MGQELQQERSVNTLTTEVRKAAGSGLAALRGMIGLLGSAEQGGDASEADSLL
jgi:hypothetical protein